jgi:hypothetical protein
MYHLVDLVPSLRYVARRDLIRACKARGNVINSFKEILEDFDTGSALDQYVLKGFGMDIVHREKREEKSELDKVMLAASWIIDPQASVSAIFFDIVGPGNSQLVLDPSTS